MESVREKMEDANRTKVSLMRALVNCLDLEREHLVNLDVKSLWSLMEEKHRILNSIVKVDEEISNCTAAGAEEERRTGQTFSKDIQRLKREIGARVRENVSFIEETLRFFDEIVSVFASGGRAEYCYEPALKRHKSPSSLIFEREV
jgi:hypothetical protein